MEEQIKREEEQESSKMSKAQERAALSEEERSALDARTAFVVNLPFNLKETQLEEIFSQVSSGFVFFKKFDWLVDQFGEIKQVRLIKERDGKSKGFAYIEFADEDSANKSLTLNESQLGGRTIKVTISNPPSKKKRDQSDTHTLFLSNLPLDATEDELRTKFGSVKKKKQFILKNSFSKFSDFVVWWIEQC